MSPPNSNTRVGLNTQIKKKEKEKNPTPKIKKTKLKEIRRHMMLLAQLPCCSKKGLNNMNGPGVQDHATQKRIGLKVGFV